MKELVSKQELIHDLYTLDISLEDMEKVERYILNYGYKEFIKLIDK